MGTIADFELPDMIQRYSLRTFVETGTGLGESLLHVVQNGFESILSCEIDKKTFDRLPAFLFADRRVAIQNERSTTFLLGALKDPRPACIFLDAHFTGSYVGVPIDPSERTPLREELAIIAELRSEGLDVIIIDDLRVYEPGPFANGDYPHKQPGLSHWLEAFHSTHDIRRDYRKEGYVILTPMKKVDPLIS